MIGLARNQINEILQENEKVEKEKERLQQELDNLILERQWVITQARKGKISDEDMDYQLSSLNLQELSYKREMAEYLGLEKVAKLKDWEQAAINFFHTLEDGLMTLNIAPQTDEERHAIFELKRGIVKLMVEQVTITEDRQLSDYL